MANSTDRRNHTVYLSLGTNIGDRMKNLAEARNQINQQTGNIEQVSAVYQTESWGNNQLDYFYNQVVKLTTDLSPLTILNKILAIEGKMGRKRSNSTQYEARIIDIDLLLMDDICLNHIDLKLPHPQMHLRNFVLYPLAEIAANTIHPVFNQSIENLKKNCEDLNKISKLG